jgi:hypothetical protein
MDPAGAASLRAIAEGPSIRVIRETRSVAGRAGGGTPGVVIASGGAQRPCTASSPFPATVTPPLPMAIVSLGRGVVTARQPPARR